MSYNHHIIGNYPKEANLLWKTKLNIAFNVGIMKLFRRQHYLKKRDYKNSQHLLKKGDVVLVGSGRFLGAVFIPGIATHALLYIGKGKLVHAVMDGVQTTTYKSLFKQYDILTILRPRHTSAEVISSAVSYAKEQVGKPYDINFDIKDTETFYCSELVHKAYQSTSADIGTPESYGKTILMPDITPRDFLNMNMDLIFHSESLCEEDGKLVYSIR